MIYNILISIAISMAVVLIVCRLYTASKYWHIKSSHKANVIQTVLAFIILILIVFSYITH